MKGKLIVLGLLTVCLLQVNSVDAQRRRRTGGGGGGGGETPPPTADTTRNPENNNNNGQPPGYDPYANLPITYDTVSASTGPTISLRNDNAFEKGMVRERKPLDYEHLRWDDAMYAEKVWRELDFREKINKIFTFKGVEDDGSQMFVSMLMNAVTSGSITAFADDRFTTPLSVADVYQKTAGGLDTSLVRDLYDINKIVGRTVTRKSFNPDDVVKMRLKEEWVFDRESSRMYVRILGIGLLKTEYVPNTKKERGTSSLFWVYYPDARPMLSKSEVYNPKNLGQNRMTWEELFESRMFSSYIVKSTLDNPSNSYIRNLVDNDILRLLEGENIKEKIFNFEQDLWSY
ncbi:MAG: gliding motility protein GldN [Bacteroidetes bacterium]|nr:gliding motility protein GldN [Bacteroidota bacterium]